MWIELDLERSISRRNLFAVSNFYAFKLSKIIITKLQFVILKIHNTINWYSEFVIVPTSVLCNFNKFSNLIISINSLRIPRFFFLIKRLDLKEYYESSFRENFFLDKDYIVTYILTYIPTYAPLSRHCCSSSFCSSSILPGFRETS